ncbi:CLCA_X family protein [Celerinatantimonas sp. MCCC 1A17872]|uniref:CLCA_X family protein n=1 Tax=Celerinatantimonas sp. MCCC 1A17872 TaxID=3177514 RepID=UPI0038C8CBBA
MKPVLPNQPIHPWQQRYHRNGPDYRFNSDISFSEIQAQFGFATIRLGRWVSPTEQQLAANLIFDALADLSFMLNVPPSVIGLRGSLHLAFGTDGNIDAKAHYQPGKRTLALAKNAGGGALAHEFWHAFDHYICSHLYPQSRCLLASDAWLNEQNYAAHPLNDALIAIFDTTLLSVDKNNPSEYLATAIALDKQSHSYYLSKPTEALARAFEAFIQDGKISNNFLASGTKQSKLAKSGGYPKSPLREQLNQNFARYFNLLGRALQN